RILVGVRAVVRPAPREDPDVPSVRIGEDAARHADLHPVRELLPAVNRMVGVVRDRLRAELARPREYSERNGHHQAARPSSGTYHLDLRENVWSVRARRRRRAIFLLSRVVVARRAALVSWLRWHVRPAVVA